MKKTPFFCHADRKAEVMPGKGAGYAKIFWGFRVNFDTKKQAKIRNIARIEKIRLTVITFSSQPITPDHPGITGAGNMAEKNFSRCFGTDCYPALFFREKKQGGSYRTKRLH